MADPPATEPRIQNETPTPDGVQALLALSGLSYRTAAEALGIDAELMLRYARGSETIPRYVMLALRYLALQATAGSRPVLLDAGPRTRDGDLPTAPVAPKSQLGDPSP